MENKAELLSPAGEKEGFLAAVNAGADAVYLGGKSFSARAFAENFSNEEIAEMISYAHVHDVKVYVTLNTLIFEDEFESAVAFAEFLYHHDVDGILLQDLGLAHYLHEVYPDLILHASTQLNCHNLAEAKALKAAGFRRIVLAREADLELVKKIKSLGVEVEVFVHGALCVCYSGQCLMSSMIGGRSGNRGRCAQPCRNKIAVMDGEKKISGDYAISTKDLNTLDYIADILHAGADSLKIEGRMKRSEYVYQVVSSYRKGIDAFYGNRELDGEKENEAMKRLYSRDFTKGYLNDESRTTLLNQKTSSHQGVLIGSVLREMKNAYVIALERELHVGDGIRYNNEYQTGQTVQKMFVRGKDVKSASSGEEVTVLKYQVKAFPGDEVILTSDMDQIKRLDEKMKTEKKLPIHGRIDLCLGKKISLTLAYLDKKVTLFSENEPEESKNHPATPDDIRDKISKLGDTPFFLENLDIHLEDSLFVPVKTLNELRRKTAEKLEELLKNRNHYSGIKKEYVTPHFDLKKEDETIFLCETKEQLEECRNHEGKIALADNLLFREENNPSYLHCLSRIDEKDDGNENENEIHAYLKQNGKGNRTSSYFNVMNSYTLDYVYSLGYGSVILSHEHSLSTVQSMIRAYQARHGENPCVAMNLYGYTDLMIMKSCPVAASYGLTKDHCNLCKTRDYRLEDRKKEGFALLHDENCVTRVLNTYPLWLIDLKEELKETGITSYVLTFTKEKGEETGRVLDAYFGKTKEKPKNITREHYLRRID